METETETGTGFNLVEMLQVADAVAQEKGIDRETVLDAMEQAIMHAGKRKYGQEHDIRADIDRKTGEISLMCYIEVADPIENPMTQISLDSARDRNPDAQAGDYLVDALPPIDFGRIAAQTAKQVIVQKVREAEPARAPAACDNSCYNSCYNSCHSLQMQESNTNAGIRCGSWLWLAVVCCGLLLVRAGRAVHWEG